MSRESQEGSPSGSNRRLGNLDILARAAQIIEQRDLFYDLLSSRLKSHKTRAIKELRELLAQHSERKQQADLLSAWYDKLLIEHEAHILLARQINSMLSDMEEGLAKGETQTMDGLLSSLADVRTHLSHVSHEPGTKHCEEDEACKQQSFGEGTANTTPKRKKRTPLPTGRRLGATQLNHGAANSTTTTTKPTRVVTQTDKPAHAAAATVTNSSGTPDDARKIRVNITNKARDQEKKRKLASEGEEQQQGVRAQLNKRRKKSDGTKITDSANHDTMDRPMTNDQDQDQNQARGNRGKESKSSVPLAAKLKKNVYQSAAAAAAEEKKASPRYKNERRKDQTVIPINGDQNNLFICKKNKGSLLEGWNEWHNGYTHPDGHRNPALKRLETKFGTRWRSGEDVKFRSTYVTRRKLVADATAKLAKKYGISEDEMIDRLESHVGPGRSEAAAKIFGNKTSIGDPLTEMASYAEHKAEMSRRKVASTWRRRSGRVQSAEEEDDADESNKNNDNEEDPIDEGDDLSEEQDLNDSDV